MRSAYGTDPGGDVYNPGNDLLFAMLAVVLSALGFAFAAERQSREKLAAAETSAARADGLRQENERLRADASRADARLAGEEKLKGELTRLQGQLVGESRLRQEILGLKGKLIRVVFIVDRSGSMEEGGRWEQVRELVQTWVSLLPVEEAAMILFGEDIRHIPTDRLYVDVRSGRRDELTNPLRSLRPNGETPMMRALDLAYSRYPTADTFILFTDGEPTDATVEQILDQHKSVWQSRKVVINTVALGDYFRSKQGQGALTFLVELANQSSGSFRAR